MKTTFRLIAAVRCAALPVCVALVVALVATAVAREARAAPDPVEIRVDATVSEALGSWPLGAGVPFPQGKIKPGSALRLRAEKQGVLPVQVTEKTRWPDGSVQWTWLDFQGDPRDRYFLEQLSAAQPAPVTAVKVSQDDACVTIDAGAMSVTWDKSLALPTRIRVGETRVVEGDGQGIYVVDNRGRRGVLGGKGAELAWNVESSGPLRAVLRVEGWYVTGGGERLARAVVRYYLYAARAFFTMDHTFIFTEDTDQLWFKEVAVRFPWQGAESAGARFGVKDAPEITAAIGGEKDEAWIFQDDYPHFAQKRAHFSCGKREGEVAAGWCEAADGSTGITVAIQDLARQFPKELAAGRGGVTARLWSNRGGKELDYRPGTLVDDYYGGDWFSERVAGWSGETVPGGVKRFRKANPSGLGSARTHFLFCGYHVQPPDPKTSPRWAALFDRPPVALADPAWLCNCGALWRVAPKDEKLFAEAEQFISEYFDIWMGRMQEFPMNGWIGRGVGPELRYERRADGKTYAVFYRLHNVAAYHTPKNVWVGYYRSGDRKFLDFAEPYTRFLADFSIAHWGGGRTNKHKGLIVSGTDPFPLYWASSGMWDTGGQSTDYLVPFRLAWFLRDSRWARDCLELYANAMNRDWDLDKCRTFGTPFTHLSMMVNAYLVTQDPRLAENIHKLADALVDLNDPMGFSEAFYARKPSYGATYKFERKILALLDYYDAFGAEKARKAVIKANQELLAIASQSQPLSYQNHLPVHLARCFEWTGNPDYAAAAAAHLDCALDWFREFKATPPERRSLSSFTPDKQCFPFFSVPHMLAILSDAKYVKRSFPYLANQGRDHQCPIYFLKEKGREASLLVSVLSSQAEPPQAAKRAAGPKVVARDLNLPRPAVAPRVVGPDGRELADCCKEEPMHHAKVYRVTIPAAAAPGAYRVSLGPNCFLVIGSNVDKLVLCMPEGTCLGHLDYLGYSLTRNKPYYFQVPEGQESFTIQVSHPVAIFDPSGTQRDEAKGKKGRLTFTDPQSGLWSFIPGASSCVQLEDLPPVVAFGEKSRLFIPPGVERAKLQP